MTLQERAYYRQRAITERTQAAKATAIAPDIHLELACLYEKLVELEEERPTLTIVA